MRKIIFLDIDGVLNSHTWWDKFYDKGFSKDPKYDFDLDPEAIELLNKIQVLVPSVEIVITSTWRYDFKETVDRLKAQGLKIPVVGYTTTESGWHEGTYMPRGVLVKKWLDDNIKTSSSVTCNYVILDDDIDFLIGQRFNFINTDYRYGLTMRDVDMAITILGPDPEVVEETNKYYEDKMKHA